MSYFIHCGYGYSKRRCEDVTTWFLNKYFPRHKIFIDIIHRGLKREGVNGYCDTVDECPQRPREFQIELDTHMSEELYIKTLLHELTHMKQWVDGTLQVRYGKLCYSKEPVENYDYWHQPHEIEARKQEKTLYVEYMKEKNPVPFPQVVQFFPNRLMEAL